MSSSPRVTHTGNEVESVNPLSAGLSLGRTLLSQPETLYRSVHYFLLNGEAPCFYTTKHGWMPGLSGGRPIRAPHLAVHTHRHSQNTPESTSCNSGMQTSFRYLCWQEEDKTTPPLWLKWCWMHSFKNKKNGKKKSVTRILQTQPWNHFQPVDWSFHW